MCSRKFNFKLCIMSLFVVYIELSAIRHSTSNYFPIVYYIKIANFRALFGRHRLIQFTNDTS